jgi:hypothetical protein
MTRKSVQGGYCNWPDNTGCALTKLECDDPANWLSSRQMQNGPVNAHGGSCRWQESIKSTVLGKCSKDGALTECATDVGACPPDSGWEGPELGCTVETTAFGRCDYGMCAWSHDQCTVDNTWAPFDEGCTCDKVQVGGCSRLKDDGEKEVFCAVSEDACDDEQTWVDAQNVKIAAGFDCFLCREISPAVVPETANDMDVSGTSTNTASTIATTTESASKISAAGTTIIIVSAILGTLLALLIVGLVMWRVFRTKRAVKRAAEYGKEQAPPATAIEVNTFGIDGRDSTDMDNASVLSDDA